MVLELELEGPENNMLTYCLPQADREGGTKVVPLPPQAKCIHCGGAATIAREVSLARHAWDHLKPLESNADTINVERHLPKQFQLSPPRMDTGMLFHAGYGNILSGEGSRIHDPERPYSPTANRSVFPGSTSFDRPNLLPHSLVSPQTPHSPKSRLKSDTPYAEHAPSEDLTSSDGLGCIDTPKTSDPRWPSSGAVETPISPDFSRGSQSRLQSFSNVSFEPEALTKSRTIPLVAPPEKGRSRWSKLTGSRREVPKPATRDSSSLSSTTLESQRLEEFSLKNLVSSSKVSSRGKSGKSINVYISQNSTYALFWTQAAINIWDVGNSSPLLGRAISTESNCVLAAVTKVHLAYIIGTRDQKLTVSVLAFLTSNR
jgi:hypothetical protein